MKRILFILLTVIVQSCWSGEDYSTIRREVLDAHDKVMIDGELAVKNGMELDVWADKLDSLRKQQIIADTLKERQQINDLRMKLDNVDQQMNEWMHKFNADVDGKSNREAINYFKSEKKKLQSLDSLYKKALAESNIYLSKFQKK